MKWSRPFDPEAELIWVTARLSGPTGLTRQMMLVLDTGTANTLIEPRIAYAVGLDPKTKVGSGRVQGVSGPPVRGPRIPAPAFEVLGRTVNDFVVTCLPLSGDQTVDGVLGLDFFRRMTLSLDFEAGLITLEGGGAA